VLGENAKEESPRTTDSTPTIVKTVSACLGFGEAPLIVKGYDDLLVLPREVLHPIPGDEIVGYITRGRGVAVHTRLCPTCRI